ncbi:MAG: type I 3-dehydroquinate dehydratase [Phycisphaerae bacterium]
MPTMVCVPIVMRDVHQALADCDAAREGGADLVEFRVDEFFSGNAEAAPDEASREMDDIVRVVSQAALPCIVTCRLASEGGVYEADEMSRVAMLERVGTARERKSWGVERAPRYIDVEWAAFEKSANLRQKVKLAVEHPAQLHEAHASLIASTHDFTTRPADLSRRVAAMANEPATSVVKVAYRARSLHDALELLDLAADAHKPTIALGMGEYGVMSRVLARKFGALLTFASLRSMAATAPGQPTLRELLELYRFRKTNSRTRVYGIVGSPVSQSLSPLVHNAGFEATGFDGVYVPLPIAAVDDQALAYASFRAMMLELIEHPRLTLCGCSVTMPHKERLAQLASDRGWLMDEATRATGAANTLTIRRDTDGQVLAISVQNTDAAALRDTLTQAVGGLGGKRLGVLGAGGAGKAAAWALAQAGATVVVYNRSLGKAETLANELRAHIGDGKVVAAAWELLERACCDVFVNCTPIGMAGTGASDESALPVDRMQSCGDDVTVMDTVYNPLRTPTLTTAARRGWKTVDGAGMFARQAAAQFHAWTAQDAPAALFERLVRDELARREAANGEAGAA